MAYFSRETTIVDPNQFTTPKEGLGRDMDNSDLAWVVPIILLVIAASIGLGLLLFYCIRGSELWCIRCLYRCCGACADTIHRQYKSDKEEYRRLREQEETGVKMRLTGERLPTSIHHSYNHMQSAD